MKCLSKTWCRGTLWYSRKKFSIQEPDGMSMKNGYRVAVAEVQKTGGLESTPGFERIAIFCNPVRSV